MMSAGLHRRSLLTALLAVSQAGLLAPGFSHAADDEDPALALRRNLFTRVSGPVLLNGVGPFDFVIDTGASVTSIGDHLIGDLGLSAGPAMLVHGITGPEVMPSVGISRLGLGGERFRNLRCPVLPRDRLGADGLIGLDVLSRFRLRFDIRRQTASLTEMGSRISMGGDAILASRVPGRSGLSAARGAFGQLVTTSVLVDGVRTAAFVDSGAQYSIGNRMLLQALSVRAELGRVRVFGVTGQTIEAEIHEARDVRLGPSRLGPTRLVFADLHCFRTLRLESRPALVLGADLLSRFREVTLDFRGGNIAFTGLQRPEREIVLAG